MLGRSLRWVAAALTAVSFAAVASPAFADGTADVYRAIDSSRREHGDQELPESQQKQEVTRRQATSAAPSVAQAPPVQQQPHRAR